MTTIIKFTDKKTPSEKMDLLNAFKWIADDCGASGLIVSRREVFTVKVGVKKLKQLVDKINPFGTGYYTVFTRRFEDGSKVYGIKPQFEDEIDSYIVFPASFPSTQEPVGYKRKGVFREYPPRSGTYVEENEFLLSDGSYAYRWFRERFNKQAKEVQRPMLFAEGKAIEQQDNVMRAHKSSPKRKTGIRQLENSVRRMF